jgi:hypothetical protein
MTCDSSLEVIRDMRTFTIWYKKSSDGRAPECAFLADDYTQAGDLEAPSVKQLQQLVQMGNSDDPEAAEASEGDQDLHNHRALAVGDVVQDENRFYILTPIGVWADVQVFLD